MTPREEELYWRGTNFPGTLSQSEFDEWARIVNAYEKRPSEEEQAYWSNVWALACVVMCCIAVLQNV
jgi:hypothetical protein